MPGTPAAALMPDELPALEIVEFPGYLADKSKPERALAALGGIAAIEQAFGQAASAQGVIDGDEASLTTAPADEEPRAVRAAPAGALQLSFGAENAPAPHPVAGTIVPTCNLVISVTTRPDGSKETRIAGIVLRTARFRSLADFQFALDAADPVVQLQRLCREPVDWERVDAFDIAAADRWTRQAVECAQRPGFLPDGPVPATFAAPPPRFSNVTVPQSYDYRQVQRAAKAPSAGSMRPAGRVNVENVAKADSADDAQESAKEEEDAPAVAEMENAAGTAPQGAQLEQYIDELMAAVGHTGDAGDDDAYDIFE